MKLTVSSCRLSATLSAFLPTASTLVLIWVTNAGDACHVCRDGFDSNIESHRPDETGS